MMQDGIGREGDKRILDPNCAYTRLGGESSEKNSQKIQKIKKQLSVVIFSQIVMTQDQIGRERDKKILDPNSAHTRLGGVNSVKKYQKNLENQRTTIRHYFQPNRDETGRERENRILEPNSAQTGPGGENSEKNSYNIQKIKKELSVVIYSQNGMRQEVIGLGRGKIILDPNSAHTRPGGANSEKKIAKKFKKLKNNFPSLFLDKS